MHQHQLRLSVIEPTGRHEHVLRDSPVVLGRDLTNQVVLADPRVSTFHVQFEWERGLLTVRDLGSGNRTILIDPHEYDPVIDRGGRRCPSGVVDVKIGNTHVCARLERLHLSFVPSEVLVAATAACVYLRRSRASDNDTSSSRVLESAAHSVRAIRKALETDLPRGALREARPADDTRHALIDWSNELLRSFDFLADKGARESGSPDTERSPTSSNDDPEPPSGTFAEASSEAVPITGVVRRPRRKA